MALAAASIASPAEAKWLRAETDSFIIYSEGNEKSLREFAANLQRFDATLRSIFRTPYEGEDNRLPIYLLPTSEDVGELASGSRGSSIAGYYRGDRDGSFALSHRETGDANPKFGTPMAQQVLFHEYTHHFMKRHLRAAFPAWFIEGFAEYHSTVDFDKDGRAELGKPVYSRAYGLLRMPRIPAEKLLVQQPGEMRNSGQTDVYYGRAWILTHMLYQDAARDGQMGAYVAAINAGTDTKQAATQVFGDLAQLDKDLNRYINGRLSYSLTRTPIPVPTNIAIAPLAADEDAVIEARLERLNARGSKERETKARDLLRKLVAADPANAEAQYEYAAAEWDMDEDLRDLPAVRAALDKALAAKPSHVRANVLLGRFLLHELDEKGEDDPAAWREARKPIQLANRTDPLDPVPLYAYFSSFLDQRVRPSEPALKALERAFQIAPENVEVRVSYAFALANRGEFDTALALAKSVAFDPHDNGRGETMLKRLEEMRDAHAKRGGGKDADAESDDAA
ncbi:MAG: hypothetical protein C0520_02775 [Sphingopyxis sp.]|nr:hypothetical protein [Sphingopyxis sp.]